jgi:hypothetical protein
MSREIAYMVDTNVLCDWLESYIPQIKANDDYYKSDPLKWANHQKKLKCIKQFMEQNENTIYIPDLVWSEFLGVTLHKDMDVSGDLRQLKQHFRLLMGVIQQMEAVIQNSPHLKIFSAQSENFQSSPFANAAELATDIDLIDQKLFDSFKRDWLKKSSYKKTKGAKFMDGMDAVIVAYLDNLAANHPEQRLMLYTGDIPMFNGVARIRSYWQRNGFSQNTGAICSLFPKVRTRNRNDYSSDVLIRADVKDLGLL